MMPTPANSRPGAEVISGKRHAGIIGNEGGFILAFVMFMLAICMLLGIASMNTSVDEIDISTNEVIVKRTFTLAESGLPLAAIPLLTTQATGTWDTSDPQKPVYLDDADPLKTATSGVIQIVDGNFLSEGADYDSAYGTGWNNVSKYRLAKLAPLNTAHVTAYMPIDDPFGLPPASATETRGPDGTIPDLRIRAAGQLVIDVDVDKADVAYLAGGVAEFGSGAEGGAGTAYKLIYLFDCKATLPSRNILDSSSPVSEVILGYRFVPDSGI